MSKITLAGTAGFCYGVRRAVEKAFEVAASGKDAVTLGPIIHNPQIVSRLAALGVPEISSPEEAKEGQTVIIRSHGVPAAVYDALQGREIVDCTCPNVARIHRIAREVTEAGKVLLVAGNPHHPEVEGIVGHAKGEVYVFQSEAELADILSKLEAEGHPDIAVVQQTTFSVSLWKNLQVIIENRYTNAEKFDTICNATHLRQQEAASLAQKSDLMIVIGGRESSNTQKLYEICAKKCETAAVESKSELDKSQILRHNNIGVTAGASTPADIIKEVLTTMSEILENQEEELSFAELFEQSQTEKLYNGKRVKGIVSNITPNEIHVDVGAKQTGIVPASELSEHGELTPDSFHVGDEIDLVVVKVNDQEGVVTLSKKRLDAEANYNAVCKAFEEGTVLTGTVTDVIKGGILVNFNGLKVFVPASLASDRRMEDLSVLLNKEVQFKVIEVNDRRRRAVGSVKAVLQEAKKAKQEEFWQNVEIGKVYTGEVKSLTSYGAFVDLGGVDGMIHITELSWTRIKSPEEVVHVGDTVEVYIKDIDYDKKKISLGYKKEEDNPWEIFKRDYPIDTICPVKIVSITTFGAFAQIIPGVDGLIHISQIANERIAKVSDKLAVGDVVDAMIIDIDYEKKKVSLSIRATLNAEDDE
ncbi:MAG TPA: bifunctional 4-hydroxy-3-methylbut-2-enyl diphosphate reductase/30S ribosomal protein S1 [Candidatus Faecivivens stercoravium]|uniref:4-hydroxy-3-methylbut-2-enyl diphosphate reductase n=1 Tax=Candidatus Faecivivens stercoravium TaxID=2840803 RepID=A0A9D1DYJ2_9FIRM|nr:bifunctional 4-hydroxy-3-methylbut-2-enyl diphosphate reductase/30S ribosomal protein S1 [Candidatus Faecivivens stercoravium]